MPVPSPSLKASLPTHPGRAACLKSLAFFLWVGVTSLGMGDGPWKGLESLLCTASGGGSTEVVMWGSLPTVDGLLPSSILQGLVDASGLEAASEEEWTSRKQRQLLIATLDPGRPAAWGPHSMHRWIGQESCCDCSVRVTDYYMMQQNLGMCRVGR